MKVEIGDKITALGYTFEIAKIMYQDYYKGYWDVEFLDPNGGYHHWKSIYDGGVVEKGKKMNNYLFCDNETGEEFFAQADTKKDAWGIVFDNFGVNPHIVYCGMYSDEEAEMMGYDTY